MGEGEGDLSRNGLSTDEFPSNERIVVLGMLKRVSLHKSSCSLVIHI